MTDTRPKLTARQERILDTIRSAVRDRGYPPTLRELTAAVGISSSSTAAEQLRILQHRGYIRVTPNTPRGILLLDPASDDAAAVERVLALCARWDAVSKGESSTTRQIRNAIAGRAEDT